jgi:predicted Rossmann fold flavoprotein
MPSDTTTFDVIVLGAGAAGLFCAILAGRRQRRVLLIDHADKAGKKILISGGGRCNFTNLHTRPENFLSANPHFARSALSRFTPADFIALVEQHNIPYHEKTLGQLFCDHSAQQIVTMLEREAAAANVRTLLGTKISSVTTAIVQPATKNQQLATSNQQLTTRFRVETSAGTFHSDSVVVATGGLSIPKMGATPFGYQLAAQFGLNIIPTRPALVPLVFTPEDHDRWCDLSGLSAEVIATAVSAPTKNPAPRKSNSRQTPIPVFREKFLITHRGLSGPAILQASSYWQPGQSIQLDLVPGIDVMAPMLASRPPVQSAARAQVFAPIRSLPRRDLNATYDILRTTLPARLAERWLTLHPPLNWTNGGLTAFEQHLHAWTITPAGTEGYAKAEVTAGGVDTDELDSQTMQSKRVPGLYFIGEVVDVTGWLGGYNLQWAWASAHAAATSL